MADAADVLALLAEDRVRVPLADVLGLGDGAEAAAGELIDDGRAVAWADEAGADVLTLGAGVAAALGLMPDADGMLWVAAAGLVNEQPRARPELIHRGAGGRVRVYHEADRTGPPRMADAEDPGEAAWEPGADPRAVEPWRALAAAEQHRDDLAEHAARVQAEPGLPPPRRDPAAVLLVGTSAAWDHRAMCRPDPGGGWACLGCGSRYDAAMRRRPDSPVPAPGVECLSCAASGRPPAPADAERARGSLLAWLAARPDPATGKPSGATYGDDDVPLRSLAGGTGKAAKPPKGQGKAAGRKAG